MTKQERDKRIEELEKAACSHARSRNEHQVNINEIEAQIANLRDMRCVPEIDIQRWHWDRRGMELNDDGAWYERTAVEAYIAAMSKPAPYEKGKVFWDEKYLKVFQLTGKLSRTCNWYWSLTLIRRGSSNRTLLPSVNIIVTPVYWRDDVPYIHDGGDERVPKIDEWYLLQEIPMHMVDDNGYISKHKIFIPLTVVG